MCGCNSETRESSVEHQTPPLAAETETLREAYAALNRNDIPAMVKLFDPDMEWIEPSHYPGGGTFRGHAAMIAHFSQARDKWAEGSCAPEEFIVVGEKLVVYVHVRVRLKDHTKWIDARLADVYTFRNGKAVQMRHFPNREDALAWAGGNASAAT